MTRDVDVSRIPHPIAPPGLRDRLSCLIGRHQRLGRMVSWDGRNFRSVCRYCRAPLYKHGNTRWRAVVQRKDVLLLTYRPDPEA